MKKQIKLKSWVKVSLLVIGVLVFILLLSSIINNIKKENKAKEEAMVQEYVTCLENNWTQRDYCAREIGSSYYYMDQVIAKYGYSYIQKGYDLYIVKEK